MSLLDIRQAKEALAWRLHEWGIEDNPGELAASFIDDLVAKGWRMDAMREDRPQPPKAGEECGRCGQSSPCHCTREQRATDYRAENPRADQPADPRALLHAELAIAKAAQCGCGVRREMCPAHRETEEES